MAETAATALGISGIVGVLQSLLQCYKDFLTARDFGDDFAPRNEFLIQQPTKDRAALASKVLELIRTQLDKANQDLDLYTTEEASSSAIDAESPGDKASKMTRIANKLHRTVNRQHDAEHPGTLKRTTWALVDKSRLEATLGKVTMLVDRLNTDFAPVDQKQQLDKYCEVVKELKLGEEELRELGAVVGDRIFKMVVSMLQCERATGNKFVSMNVTKESTLNIGDYYDKDFKGGVQRQSSRNDTFEETSVTDTAFVNIGDNFGGNSPMQIRLEQQKAARRAEGEGASN